MRVSPLDGLSADNLQSQLTALQTAYLALMSGQKVVTASYTQGDGAKSVTYTASEKEGLLATIQMVQDQIRRLQGLRGSVRRPMRPFF